MYNTLLRQHYDTLYVAAVQNTLRQMNKIVTAPKFLAHGYYKIPFIYSPSLK